MSARKWYAAVAAGLLLVPMGAIGEDRAIRQSGLNCYLSGGTNASVWVGLFNAGGLVHDWGLGSKVWSNDPVTGIPTGGTIFCPVPLDVPRMEANAIERVRILYSTRDPGFQPTGFTPKLENCAAYLMDGTTPGTWVGSADPSQGLPPPGSNLYSENYVEIVGATAKLGSANLRRMVITCTMPRSVYYSSVNNQVFSALVRAYEVQYKTGP